MAEQVAIPAGVDVSRAIPGGVDVHQRTGAPAGPTVPPLPSSADQKPGFAPPAPPSPAGDDQYAQFLAWQKSQAATTPAVAPPAPPAPAVKAPEKTAGFEGMGADAALDAVKNHAASDPYLQSTFSLFSMVAPDVNLARAVGNAIDRGDPSLIDAAYLKEAGGDKADQLISVAQNLVKHVTAETERVVGDLHTMAGGQAQFNDAVAVFNKSAPQYLKDFVTSGIDSANPAKIKSAVGSMLDFVRNSGALPVPPQGQVRAGGGSPDAALGLSKEAYQAERLKLDRRARDFPDRERELTARRQMGKQLGM